MELCLKRICKRKIENYNVAIVILNYLNYKDTENCIKSIDENRYIINGIVVVDNASSNESVEVLKEKYKDRKDIFLISNKKNLGFAKGNNAGIRFARNKLNADFVFVCNNDVLFLDPEYFNKLLDLYEDKIGVIGSQIVDENRSANPIFLYSMDEQDNIYRYLNHYSSKKGCSFDFPTNHGKETQILHGCALLLTPAFFIHYKGFYKKTFLYMEEMILFYMCKCAGLKQIYTEDTQIMHLEDRSSQMSFNNDLSIMNEYSGSSLKYVAWWALKVYVMKKIGLIRK